MTRSEFLLTPGPLSVSERVRAAMERDWGSRDQAFVALTADIRRALLDIAGAREGTTTAVPMQGAGTFAVEAMIAAFAPREKSSLVLVNGAYGRRMCEMLQRLGRPFEALVGDETKPIHLAAVEASVERAGAVILVHCETTSGVLNPLTEIATMAQTHNVPVLVDAMSSFGAIPIEFEADGVTALAASSNKCLQGVPGLGFVICDRAALTATKGQSPSLSLDLEAQNAGFEATGEWRFTPPTHVVAALAEALLELRDEGGPRVRYVRYRTNLRRLVTGMAAMGLHPLVAAKDQAPIIVTFAMPDRPGFTFTGLYNGLKERGFLIYPGKLTQRDSFRVGCIGDVFPKDIDAFIVACRAVLDEMAIKGV